MICCVPMIIDQGENHFTHRLLVTNRTLIKLITGDLIPTKGNVKRNMHLKISRFTQHFEEKLDLSMTPLDFFKQKVMPEEPIEKIRPLLGRYGCTGAQQSQIMGQLSAGQKARIVFAIIAHEKPHVRSIASPCLAISCNAHDKISYVVHISLIRSFCFWTSPLTHWTWNRLMRLLAV